MKKNNKGAAIMIGMFLIIFLTLTMYVLMAQIVPFSRNTAGIQNASNAYYQAYAGIEDSLYKKNSLLPLNNTGYASNSVAYKYDVSSNGSVVPAVGKGDSDNTDYSKISIGKPIQLKLETSGLNLNNSRLCFKVPDGLGDFVGSGPIIFWSLTSSNDTLNGTDLINGTDINDSAFNCTTNYNSSFSIGGKSGNKLDGSPDSFSFFYTSNCQGTEKCILRLSVINELKAKLGAGTAVPIPYLEYQIRMGGNIELYHTTIESSGKSYGFKKDLKVQVPQSTLNQAFDFTVFQ